MRTPKTKIRRQLVIAAVAIGLGACSADMDDLHAYVDEVKARPGGIIAPLPQVVPPPSYSYDANERRSPFMPETPQERAAANPDAVDGPDPNRPREFLEQFSLDTLRMVGTLDTPQGAFGLVQTSDGLIYRVAVGHHLGQNYGRVTSISEAEIELVEIISDGIGGYLERPAAIGLSD
ncbi:MAG TPA: pilus assembly protein PilP [Gammaproteobacteria bacterium]